MPRRPCHRPARLALAAAAAGVAVGLVATRAAAQDRSAPAILQWFDGTYATQEARAADVFAAGYGAVWIPPTGRADSGNQSVGYDVYDRFDLGSAGRPTLYGTETGLKSTVSTWHRAGVDTHVDLVLNHNGFSDLGTPGFAASGGYPGFVLQNPDGDADPFGVPNTDGDFNGPYAGGTFRERLAGLIDIDHGTNHRFVRNPVPGFNNLPAGTTERFGRLANVPDEANRRFYPDRDGPAKFVFDPRTGERDIPVYSFDRANPTGGDPVEENATGYLMRHAQWMVQEVGVDGFRLDATKHLEPFVLDYYDRAVYRANDRTLLDGSTKNVFSYVETFDGDVGYLNSFVRKDIDAANPGRVGGDRDALDFAHHFAAKANLTTNGFQNDWRNVVNAGMDVADDGRHNGSAGVRFVASHDDGGPALSNVAHAYDLMYPGNTVVYFNGEEHGTGRDFPKDGRGDALGGLYGEAITTLTTLRNTHGRGDYRQRVLEKENFAFEREGSALVMLSNRTDAGFDSRTIQTSFAPGTPLVELTGNAGSAGVDPRGDIPRVLVVNGDGTVNARFQRNGSFKADGSTFGHGNGYLVYGLSGPQGTLSLTGTSGTLAGGTPTAATNGSTRLADVDVVTADSFGVTLNTQAVRHLGTIRDRDADGDNALISLNGGTDLNGNGRVDFVTPGTVAYGFEQFTGTRRPGYAAADGNGQYAQQIDATGLAEGYHFLEVRAFRHRDDGGPAVYTPFKRTVYVDRLKPVSDLAATNALPGGSADGRQFVVRSADGTADSVHTFLDLPAGLSDAEVLAYVDGGNRAGRIDRDQFAYGFDGLASGNHALTVVTYEITGNVNVQRFAGLGVTTTRGRGVGDLNADGAFTAADVAGPGAFEQVLYSKNRQFSAAADANADGRVDSRDLFALADAYAGSAASAEYRAALLRRGNVNGAFGTDAFDIDAVFARRGAVGGDGGDWTADLDADGVVGRGDVDTLVTKILLTTYGDANLDRRVDEADLQIVAASFDRTDVAWSLGDFTGDRRVDALDVRLLALNWSPLSGVSFAAALRSVTLGGAAVPEPTAALSLLSAALLALPARPRRRRRAAPTRP